MQDLYKTLSKDILKRYTYYSKHLENIEDRIARLEASKSKTTITYGMEGTSGGGSDKDSTLLNINAEIELLSYNRQEARELIRSVNNALKAVDLMEKDILLTFYGSDEKNTTDLMMEKYNYGSAQIYRIANSALRKFSQAYFLQA